MKLTQQNLPEITKNVPGPTYDRRQLKTGIVHIGVGGFHRAHQAYYVHQLLEQRPTLPWAITGVGLREGDRAMNDALQQQNGLYTLVTQHPDGTAKSEVIGSIRDYLLAVDTPQAVIDRMAHPDTKIVSLTITEGGYNFNPNTGAFNFDHPDVQHELANPGAPRTVYGYLTAALRQRREKNLPPFTILSCDNIQHNGTVARRMLLAFAERQDPELATWIAETVTFPNCMVDRITPVTTSTLFDYLDKEYGLADAWPVVCEPYLQWVIEDKFVNGRPPLETLGVQFVPDVTPYETMKIRLLNAGHSVLGIPGALHGHPTIDACTNDPVFAGFMRRFMDREVSPVLDPVPGVDIEAYKDSLNERFANPNIKDGVARICAESSAKLPKFLVPTIRENLERGGDIQLGTFILAAWCYYSDQQHNERGEPLDVTDAMAQQLHRAAQGTRKDWTSFLQQPELFGELRSNERFVTEYTQAVRSIYQEGNVRQRMAEMIGA